MNRAGKGTARGAGAVCLTLWAAGLIGLPFGHWCLLARIEPFYSSIYTFLWWPFILAADFAVYLLRGRSLLHDRPRRFLFLALWSVPVWLFFEMLNVRLSNWRYVQAPDSFRMGLVLAVFSFGTVLPAIFETAGLALGIIERFTAKGRIEGPEFELTPRRVRFLGTLGAILLGLMLCWPRYFFPFAWAFVFLMLDPWCHAKKGISLLGQMAKGDYSRLVALLAGGLLCGGLWEAWNIGARTKWIYTVPFFDELKLGEMPLLGFLGFPPFALECYAIVNFLTLYRWRPRVSKKRLWLFRGAMAAAVLVAVYVMIAQLVLSFSEPLDRYFGEELGKAGRTALKRENALETHQFLKLSERPPEISPALFDRMREVSVMAELKGMGLQYATALRDLGIRTPEALARQNPRELARRLRGILGADDAPTEAQAKVWIRAAASSTRIGQDNRKTATNGTYGTHNSYRALRSFRSLMSLMSLGSHQS